MSHSPCLSCGACCAFFRASFYWAEASDVTENGVPVEMTEKLTDFRRIMRGTNQEKPRCIALLGIIGAGVHCAIYEQRSSTCREFPASWSAGEPNDGCAQARAAWGLAPLLPDLGQRPEDFPKAA